MKDVSNSPWLDPELVELKIAENAAKAKADREQLVLRGKIARNRTRTAFARIALRDPKLAELADNAE